MLNSEKMNSFLEAQAQNKVIHDADGLFTGSPTECKEAGKMKRITKEEPKMHEGTHAIQK